jgi:cephalosporin hydroxylase
MGENVWHSDVPDEEEFAIVLSTLRSSMGEDALLRAQSLRLMEAAHQYKYAYHLRWMGVPIIRLAEDLIRQQEIIFALRPDLIVELGVARGGGLLFNASMQELCGINPRVLGIDNSIFPHTTDAILNSKYRESITLLESDSDSPNAIQLFLDCLQGCNSVLLILDSDHSSKHVLSELRSYFQHLPIGSFVIVCDTIIDELPPGTYPDRTWADGKGPGHAVSQFLRETPGARLESDLTADLLITEIKGGILSKIA